MTPTGRRVFAAVAGALVAVALAACTATTSPVRTAPNAVERAAVEQAAGRQPASRVPLSADTGWTQLWTPDQFPARMEACVGDRSHGQMTLDPASFVDGIRDEIVWHITGSGSHPTSAEAHVIIDYCRSLTPVDDRAARLPSTSADALYSYDLTVLKPCLIAHGFTVGAVPTRARFAALLGGGTPWSPYDGVVVPDRAHWYALSDACPALPDALAAKVSTGS